jgi:hypothetical protein
VPGERAPAVAAVEPAIGRPRNDRPADDHCGERESTLAQNTQRQPSVANGTRQSRGHADPDCLIPIARPCLAGPGAFTVSRLAATSALSRPYLGTSWSRYLRGQPSELFR